MALALCVAACVPSALAEEYAQPNPADGWNDNGEEWKLEGGKDGLTLTYTLPFKSDKSILVRENASLTAPSIEVEGDVVSTANGIIECAGLLSAAYVEAGVYSIKAGSLVCKKVSVPSTLIVRDSFSCTGPVEVDGTLVLPADTTQEEVEALNATGDGLIFVGPKAYKPDGTPVDGATVMLFDGSDASDTGLTWDGSTCTLTLDGFTRTYQEEKR